MCAFQEETSDWQEQEGTFPPGKLVDVLKARGQDHFTFFGNGYGVDVYMGASRIAGYAADDLAAFYVGQKQLYVATAKNEVRRCELKWSPPRSMEMSNPFKERGEEIVGMFYSLEPHTAYLYGSKGSFATFNFLEG
jgi:hypothetical protein